MVAAVAITRSALSAAVVAAIYPAQTLWGHLHNSLQCNAAAAAVVVAAERTRSVACGYYVLHARHMLCVAPFECMQGTIWRAGHCGTGVARHSDAQQWK
jgi:hypothetical protein